MATLPAESTNEVVTHPSDSDEAVIVTHPSDTDEAVSSSDSDCGHPDCVMNNSTFSMLLLILVIGASITMVVLAMLDHKHPPPDNVDTSLRQDMGEPSPAELDALRAQFDAVHASILTVDQAVDKMIKLQTHSHACALRVIEHAFRANQFSDLDDAISKSNTIWEVGQFIEDADIRFQLYKCFAALHVPAPDNGVFVIEGAYLTGLIIAVFALFFLCTTGGFYLIVLGCIWVLAIAHDCFRPLFSRGDPFAIDASDDEESNQKKTE